MITIAVNGGNTQIVSGETIAESLANKSRGWKSGRPIYHRLPAESGAYQGNIAIDAITSPFDKLLMDYRDRIMNFDRDYLNPDTAKAENLDWLAQLVGYTGEYWDTSWTVAQKRKLIKRSHQFVWANKGSQVLLEWLLNDVFEIGATIYQPGSFRLNISRLNQQALDSNNFEYWIVMPLTIRTTSPQWKLAERLNRLYMPAFTLAESKVIYDQFYLDQSAIGHPLLS